MVDDVLVLTKGSSCYFCSTYVASQYDFTQTIFKMVKAVVLETFVQNELRSTQDFTPKLGMTFLVMKHQMI